MRYAARTDANKAEIVCALRAAGCVVYDLKLPVDLAIWYEGKRTVMLIEIKDGNKPPSRRKLTDHQRDWMEAGLPFSIVTDVEGALAAARVLKAGG